MEIRRSSADRKRVALPIESHKGGMTSSSDFRVAAASTIAWSVLLCLSLIAASPVVAAAQSDPCGAILKKNGAFNSIIRTSARSADEQVFDWLKTVTWQEFSKKQNAGLKIVLPIDDLPVGIDGKYSEEQFSKFTELRDQGHIRFFREDEFKHSVDLTASKEIAAAWLTCILETDGKGLICRIAADDRQESGALVFRAKYIPLSSNDKEPVIRGLSVVNATVSDSPNLLAPKQKVLFGGTSVTIKREGRKNVTVTLSTDHGDCRPQSSDAIVDIEKLALQVQVFPVVSDTAPHPLARATVPEGYKVIGGGALANWRGAGSLLISSYPSNNTWVAQSKDHLYNDSTTITVWAIAIYDPKDQWEVKVESNTAPFSSYDRETVTATLPSGFAITGGGAATAPEEPGILLTGSYPSSDRTWTINALDHTLAASGQITAFVIGVRPRNGTAPEGRIVGTLGSVQPHPSAAATIPAGYILTGGGARTDCPSVGNMLTASYPYNLFTWRGEAKDHVNSCASSLTVYAIGVVPPPGSEISLNSAAVPTFSNPSFSGLNALVGLAEFGSSTAPRVDALGVGLPERRYVTRASDTLRSIALRFYDDGGWRRLLKANINVIQDPNQIPVGTILVIPPR